MNRDIQRFPGVDPRVWIAYGTIVEIGLDPLNGVFADVSLEPSGDVETCLIGSPYAGGGFGLWWPLAVDDRVLVAVPMGEPGWGPVIISRCWNSGDPPPPDPELQGAALEPGADPLLRVQAGQSLRIRTLNGDIDLRVDGSGGVSIQALGTGGITVQALGSGDVLVEALGPGKVKLGTASSAQPVALSPLVEAAIASAVTAAITGHTHVVASLGTSAPGVLAAPVTVPSTAALKTEAT